VKGLLEQAGYTVYNPTLPYHNPTQAWNPTDGMVAVQTYVDVFKKVGALVDIEAGDNRRGQCLAGSARKVSLQTLCIMADNNNTHQHVCDNLRSPA
jgi:ABC-type transport system substrate-binding protein